MKLKIFKNLKNKFQIHKEKFISINKNLAITNLHILEEKGIISSQEAIAISQGKIKNEEDLYRFRFGNVSTIIEPEDVDIDTEYDEIDIAKKR